MKELKLSEYLMTAIVILLLVIIYKPSYNQTNQKDKIEERNLNLEPKYYNLVIDGQKVLKNIEVYDFDTKSTNIYVKSENFNQDINNSIASCYLEKIN